MNPAPPLVVVAPPQLLNTNQIANNSNQNVEDDGGMEDELVSLQRKIMDLESKLNYGSTN